MTENIGGKTRNSLYWSLSLKIPYEIFRFGTSIIVARILEPKDFGIVSIATMTIYYSNLFTNFGFSQALVQRKDITNRHINTIFTFDLAVSIFFVLLFYLLAPAIASFFNSPESQAIIRVLSLIFILTTFQNIPYTLLRREINFKVISIVDSVKEVTMSTLTLVFALIGFKYWAIVIGQLVPLAIATCYLLYRSGWSPKIFYHHASFKELFNFGIWSFVSSQIYFFSTRIDRLVIGKALNPSILGIYDKAKSLYQMPVDSLSSNINSVLFTSFSRIQGNDKEIKNLLLKGTVLHSVINLPLFFGIIAVAPHFILVLFGQKWSETILPLQILCIGGVFSSLHGFVGNYIVSTGNFGKYTNRLLFATLGLFALSALAVGYGIWVVATVVVLFSIVLFYLSFNIVRERIPFQWSEFLFCVLPPLICSILMFLGIKASLFFFFSEITLLNLLSMVSIGALIYTVTILIIPSRALDDLRVPIFRDASKMLERLDIIRY